MCSQFNLIHRQHEHQIDSKDKEIIELKQRLSDALVSSKQYFLQSVTVEDMKAKLDSAHGRLRQLELCKASLQAEVQKQIETTEQALTSVSEYQELIDKHLANASRYKQELDNCQRKYRMAVDGRDVFSDKVESLEKQLREKERLLREQKSSWKKEREKLKESLQSKTNEVNCLQEAKETYEESNHQLSLSNQKLAHSLEEAEAILNVTKSDASVQMGPSLYLMISLGVQVCPEVRSEAVQFRPPMLHSYSQTHLSQNPSKLTQTVTLVPAGSCTVAVQAVRKVVVSKGCGQGGVLTEVNDIGSQTVMVSKAAFLKPGHANRDDTGFLNRNPMKPKAMERERVMVKVKTEKVDYSNPPANLAGGDGIGDMTTKRQDERDSAGTSESSLHHSFECNDDILNSTATRLKANFKGILKAPPDVKGKKAKSKSVNFPTTLETRIILSPPKTDPVVQPKRPQCANPKLKKPPLQMVTSHGNNSLQNLLAMAQDNINIKREFVNDSSFDGLSGAPASPISSEERSDPVPILCSAVKDAFSSLENSQTAGIYERENVASQTNPSIPSPGVGCEEKHGQKTEDINAPSCKKQKRL